MIGPLLCGGILLVATTAFAAQGDPVTGVGVGVESSPPSLKASNKPGTQTQPSLAKTPAACDSAKGIWSATTKTCAAR
jgi:hypothetical protein